jgi:hypothetical protein
VRGRSKSPIPEKFKAPKPRIPRGRCHRPNPRTGHPCPVAGPLCAPLRVEAGLVPGEATVCQPALRQSRVTSHRQSISRYATISEARNTLGNHPNPAGRIARRGPAGRAPSRENPLAGQVASEWEGPVTTCDLERPTVRAMLQNAPEELLGEREGLVIVDEVQRLREIRPNAQPRFHSSPVNMGFFPPFFCRLPNLPPSAGAF